MREESAWNHLKRINIVTMVNTLEPYSEWEEVCGEGRIIPAFPGVDGSFKGDILNAGLTPKIIQPTTFAEIKWRYYAL